MTGRLTRAVAAMGGDIRHAGRRLAKRPLFVSAAVLSIGIGAGPNVGVYAVLSHVMFDSATTAAASARVVRIQPGLSFPNYRDLRSIDLPIDMAAMQMATLTWQTSDAARTLSAHVVSDNFFEIVGVTPLVGRTFSAADAGSVVVLSFPFWQRHLAGDPAVIGRSLELNAWPYVIVGVLPEGFAANPLMAGMVYVPIGPRVSNGLDNRRAAQFDLIGGLRDGVLPGTALAALRAAAGQLEHEFPDLNVGIALELTMASNDAFSLLRAASAGRVVLGAAATVYGVFGLVLLVACANVAGLMLVRADERRREIAVRLALGATRQRLIQQEFAESLLIGTLGCLAGVGLWMAAASILRSVIANAATVDVTALAASVPFGYCLLIVAVVTATCGMGSAAQVYRLSRTGVAQTRLGVRFGRGFSMQRGLVAMQIAVCFVLLVAAAFFIRNVAALRPADAGFEIDRVLSVEVRLPPLVPAPDQLAIRTAIASEPGVESVSWGSPIGPPFTERLRRTRLQDGAGVTVDVRRIGPRFFETMGIPMVRGRDLIDSDLSSADLTNIVVNETFVRRFLAGVDALDQQFVRPRDLENGRPQQLLQIVGVARDSMARTLGDSRVPVIYVPQRSQSLTIRIAQTAATARSVLQDRIRQLEPPGSIANAAPFAEDLRAALAPVRITTLVLGIVAAIGLALASTGLYAIVSYVVTQRTFEIGVRVALGATQLAIGRMILRDGIRTVAVGCVFGAATSWIVARVVQALVVGQTVVSLEMLLSVTLVLLLVGMTASLRPAQHAAGTDPTQALRCE